MDSFHPHDQIVRLTRVSNPAQAHVWENALRDEAIYFQVAGDYLDAGIGDASGVHPEIRVRRQDMTQAQAVLQRCSQSMAGTYDEGTSGQTPAIGVFTDRGRAEYAVDELLRSGFTAEQIGFVFPPGEGNAEKQSFTPGHSKAVTGAETGAAAGLAVGGLVGAALASVLLPGVGPVLAGGFLAVLLGSAAGATGGGVLGALIGMSIPEDEARLYERQFQLGHTLVTVRADRRFQEAVAILQGAEERPEPKVPHHGRGRLAPLVEETTRGPGSGSVFVPEP